MQAYTIWVIFKVQPIKYILSRLILNEQLEKWPVIFKQYNLFTCYKKLLTS